MTDKQGNKVWEGEFLPFGEPLSITGSVVNNLRFPGQYDEKEIGLYQNINRTYNFKMDRYNEKDPSGFIDGTNLYVYAMNNPLLFVDPTGETVLTCCGMTSELPLTSVMTGLECMSKCLKCPIYISSGWRTASQNSKTLGAAKGSYHLQGLAADVHEPPSKTKLRKAAKECGFYVLPKAYPNRIHIDLREGKSSKKIPDDCECKKIREGQ